MSQTETLSTRVLAWVTEHFPLARERNLGMNDSLLESGIVDSLGTLDIVMFLEEEFGIQVEDDEMVADHFESAYSIAQYVGSKLAGSGT